MTLQEFIGKALLVPFKEKGRDYSGWDCYGLAHRFFKDVRKINLPEYLDYSSTRAYQELHSLINSARPAWEKVVDPKSGDVALFNLSGQPCHVALVIDPRHALHAEAKLGTFIEPLDGVMWKKRLEGVYRLCPTV